MSAQLNISKTESISQTPLTIQEESPDKDQRFQFVSVSPSKKQTFNRDLIKQFKAIQDEEIKAWRGLNTKFIQRPGQQSNEVQHIQSVNPQQAQTQQNTQRKKVVVHNSFTEELK